jgi:hypothetical protein
MIRVRWKTVWAFRCSVSFRWRMEPSRWMRWPMRNQYFRGLSRDPYGDRIVLQRRIAFLAAAHQQQPGRRQVDQQLCSGPRFCAAGQEGAADRCGPSPSSLHVLLELGHGAEGLSSVLARKTAPRDAILDTGIENLGFMPSGPIPPDPANLFSGSRLKEMLAELEEHYDLIVLDAPPVLAIADALELTAVAKVTVFVMEAGVVRVKSAQQSLMRLHRAGGR